MNNKVIHKANTRGKSDHGWLQSYHSFSFAGYYNPERMGFGVLRVLNDDRVAPAMGFSKHPHDNMEIISIPLHGDLEHRDSMGNVSVIKQHDVQIMSAGTGVFHSEMNRNKDLEVAFLQIWIYPKMYNIQPRYDQRTFHPNDRLNKMQVIVSPYGESGSLIINQDAWLLLGCFSEEVIYSYNLRRKENGLYIFVLSGSVTIDSETLNTRDAMGLWDIENISLHIKSGSELLLLDVPMQ
ncbi:MAG: pirin family protein [Flavobacteriales bacterium]|nr:pirin family protein [Flavobacteriales bacterium]